MRRRLSWCVAGVLSSVALGALLLFPAPRIASSQLLGSDPPTRHAFDTGQDLFPSLAPDGTLAYSRFDGGDWDVFVQRSGGEPVNLTSNSDIDDWQAEFSPDGEWLVFRSERDGGGLYLMDSNGREIRRLTHVGFNPSWSPDGTEIVYSSTAVVSDPSYRPIQGELSVVRVETGERRLLYSGGDAVQPQWSPTGGRIAFWAFADQGGQRDLWTIPASGGEPVPVTRDAATDWSPAWAPTGVYMYFASDRRGTMDIWRVAISPETGQVQSVPEQVTSGAVGVRGHIEIANNGRRLFFSEERTIPRVEAIAFDPDAGRVVGDPVSVLNEAARPFDVAPSPDGRKLAFYARAHAGDSPSESVFFASVSGSELLRVTSQTPGVRDRGPAWSPDGSQVAFYSDRSGNYEIWLVNADGSNLTQITRDSRANRSGVIWSPDGTRLLYRERRGLSRESFIIDPARLPQEQVLEQLPAIGGSSQYFEASSWSPDGRRIAGTRVDVNGATRDGIFLYDVVSRTFSFLVEGGNRPQWLKDNERLLYTDDAGGIHMINANAPSEREQIYSVAPRGIDSLHLAVDDTMLFYRATTVQSGIWEVALR